jgi:hypothetical protein
MLLGLNKISRNKLPVGSGAVLVADALLTAAASRVFTKGMAAASRAAD